MLKLQELESGGGPGEGARPVWWVFSGMGSQWAGMARALMQLQPFAASVRRSAAALAPHRLDLLHALTEAPQSAFDDVITSFVCIAAVQVALVDVLRLLGCRPDGILGHSVGEIGNETTHCPLVTLPPVSGCEWCLMCSVSPPQGARTPTRR